MTLNELELAARTFRNRARRFADLRMMDKAADMNAKADEAEEAIEVLRVERAGEK